METTFTKEVDSMLIETLENVLVLLENRLKQQRLEQHYSSGNPSCITKNHNGHSFDTGVTRGLNVSVCIVRSFINDTKKKLERKQNV